MPVVVEAPIWHFPLLIAMPGRLTLVQVLVALASDTLASVPPNLFAYDLAPVAPLPFTHALNV